MVMWIVAATMVFCGVAEWLHARRVRRMGWLAFGPRRTARGWTRLVGPVRVAASGALAWGLLTLLALDSGVWQSDAARLDSSVRQRHLVLALDVSPSMELEDAGPVGRETRAARAREVLRSVLERVDLRQTGVSMIAFYHDSRPVFVDSLDANVVANVLNDLPLAHAFSPGKTDMYAAVTTAAEIGREWPAGSATLLLVSDGDTLPTTDRPKLPAAYSRVLVVGTGNRYRGKFIDGHNSRQDAHSLERLALQLGGEYFDANQQHVPTTELGGLLVAPAVDGEKAMGRREAAMLAIVAGAFSLAVLGPLLAVFGGAWNSTRARPREAYRLTSESIPTSA